MEIYPAAAAFGLSFWAMNQMAYGFGYSNYYNPYYSSPVIIGNGASLNYSQPLIPDGSFQSTSQSVADQTPAVPQPAADAFDQARSDFYNGDYQSALDNVNKALVSMPKDASVNEFRALVLFALGQYQEAAAVIYAVLSVGPGWDWTTLSSLYSATDIYTDQLRKLEAYCRANPKDPASKFLLAYHYITCGHNDAGVRQLKHVLELDPNNPLATQLVQTLGGSAPQGANDQEAVPPPTPPTENLSLPIN